MSNKTIVGPAIYVADLAAYNSGILHGKFVSLEGKDRDEVYEEIESMLAEGSQRFGLETLSAKHEEFAIHDYEGFGPIKIGEYDSIQDVLDHVERMDDDPDKYFAYIDAKGESEAENYDAGQVLGPYSSKKDYADSLLEDMIGTIDLAGYLEGLGVPLASYMDFDTDRFIRDTESGGCEVFGEYDGQFYVIIP